MPPADLAELGRFLREHREQRGLSLRGLADQAGIPFTTIQHLEEGDRKPRADVLEKLAPYLKARLADLYALAGIAAPAGLPDLAGYMRTRYGLPRDAVSELEQHIADLRQRYGVQPRKGGRRGNTPS